MTDNSNQNIYNTLLNIQNLIKKESSLKQICKKEFLIKLFFEL